MAEEVQPVQLKRETLQGFLDYVRGAEAAMDETLREGPFLWSDADAKRGKQVRNGKIAVELWSGKGAIRVPSGLVHDWIGAILLPGVTVAATLARIQDYDHHQDIYRPEVIGSKLIARRGDDFQIHLRVLKKKIITVVLDTDHEVHYAQVGPGRWTCRSYTTRTAEVDRAGRPDEKIEAPDAGYGFLWRLNSYWRFDEREDGVYAECRAISLTRDIPAALKWVIEPIVRSLPKETLMHTLQATRDAIRQGHGR